MLKRLSKVLLVLAFLLFSVPLAAAQDNGCGREWLIQDGDTLSEIATQCGTTLEAIRELNPDVDADALIPGETLLLPTTQTVQPPVAAIFPTSGAPGSSVTVIANGFPTEAEVFIGAGPVASEYTTLDTRAVNAAGALMAEVILPETAVPGAQWVFVVETTDLDTEAISFPFTVLSEAPGATAALDPQSGAPGTTIRLEAVGFPPETEVAIGIGVASAEPSETYLSTTDANGALLTEFQLPEYAEPGEEWVAIVEDEQSGIETITGAFTVTGEETGTGTFESATLYFVALEDGGANGREIGCGDSLIPVEIAIEPTNAPLIAALENLLAIESDTYAGYYNALHASDLTLDDVVRDNGNFTVYLSGTLRQGGACDGPRIEWQLEETVRHFGVVESVTIFINDTALEDLIDGQ